jgi:pilus assembly protein CpaB
MNMKKLALAVVALLLAGVCAVVARNMFGASQQQEAQAAPVPEKQGNQVLVATKALPVGTILDATAFKYQPWPKELIEQAYYLEGSVDPATLAGMVVRVPITAGQPLTQGALVKPGERGFLAAALTPGMRAITVPVTAQSGVAGFIFPGDRVDLLLSQDVTGGGEGPALKTTETIIRNLRVLATDQRNDKQTDEDGNIEVVVSSNVTLEVTPKMAEKIAVAQSLGTLNFSLRSLADNSSDFEAAIANGDVTPPKDAKAEQNMLAAFAARPIDTGSTVTTGGEVSRYQRTTVPAKASSETVAAAAATAAAGGAPAAPKGPIVRVARGNNVTEVAVGGK